MAKDKKKSDTSRALADIGHRLGGAFVVPDRGKMQAVVEAYKQEMLQCRGCGASVSLVEGGKCKYCGNEIDYADYDWVVVGYEHVKEL